MWKSRNISMIQHMLGTKPSILWSMFSITILVWGACVEALRWGRVCFPPCLTRWEAGAVRWQSPQLPEDTEEMMRQVISPLYIPIFYSECLFTTAPFLVVRESLAMIHKYKLPWDAWLGKWTSHKILEELQTRQKTTYAAQKWDILYMGKRPEPWERMVRAEFLFIYMTKSSQITEWSSRSHTFNSIQ